jgi:hypothetical protein
MSALHARSIGKKDDGAQAWQQLQFAVECGLPAETGVHDCFKQGVLVMSHRFGIAATLLAFALAAPAFARVEGSQSRRQDGRTEVAEILEQVQRPAQG